MKRVLRSALGAAAVITLGLPGTIAFDPQSLSFPSSPRSNTHVRRAEEKTQIPAPISVPPSQYFDGNDGPWSTFALQVGTPPQYVRVVASTAGWMTWAVSPDGCPPGYLADCINQRGFIFYSNESLTYVPNSLYKLGIEDNLGLDPVSNAGFDTVTLGFKGSGGPSIQHSVMYSVTATDLWLGGFGVNPTSANFSNMNDPQPSFMQQLFSNKSIPSLAYGYTAGNQYRLNQVYGSLIMGGYDQNRFTSTNLTFPFAGDIQRDLVVNVQSIKTDAGSPQDLLPGGGIPMFIDSTVGQLYLPRDSCDAFETAFGLEWNSTFNFYLINSTQRETLLSQNANVTFTLGTSNSGGQTVDIVLPYRAFDLKLEYPNAYNTTAYFPLKRADNETQYTLGRTFLQEAYLIADYERRNFTIAPCLWEQEKISNSEIRAIISPSIVVASGKSSGLSGGAIAGIVIGVVAVIAIVAGLLWFLRRRKHATQRASELEAKEAEGRAKEEPTAGGDDDVAAERQSLVHGELDSDQVHEMNPVGKAIPLEMDSPYRTDPKIHGYSEMEGGEFYGPNKHYAHEMDSPSQPVYEMAGSDVHEMATPVHSQLDLRKTPENP